MEKRQIITIAGRPGSGKSTASKAVAAKLGFEQFSSGSLFRQLAAERDIDVLEANLSAEQNAEIDYLVDGKLREMGESGDKLVIDSRMAWHWMPQSFKVFLDLDLQEAAQRVLASIDDRELANEHIPRDPAEYALVLQSRLDSETRRYKKLYDADPYNTANYDLVVDTGANTPEQTVQLIVQDFQAWLQNTN
jgi:cytidylate kinase